MKIVYLFDNYTISHQYMNMIAITKIQINFDTFVINLSKYICKYY